MMIFSATSSAALAVTDVCDVVVHVYHDIHALLSSVALILIFIWHVAGPNFRYECDGRGVRA